MTTIQTETVEDRFRRLKAQVDAQGAPIMPPVTEPVPVPVTPATQIVAPSTPQPVADVSGAVPQAPAVPETVPARFQRLKAESERGGPAPPSSGSPLLPEPVPPPLTPKERLKGIRGLERTPQGPMLAEIGTYMQPEQRNSFYEGIGRIQRELDRFKIKGSALPTFWEKVKRRAPDYKYEPQEPTTLKSPEEAIALATQGIEDGVVKGYIEFYVRSEMTKRPVPQLSRDKQPTPPEVFDNPLVYRQWVINPALRKWWKNNINKLSEEERSEIGSFIEQSMDDIASGEFNFQDRPMLESETPGFVESGFRGLSRGTLSTLGAILKAIDREAQGHGALSKIGNPALAFLPKPKFKPTAISDVGEALSSEARSPSLRGPETTGVGELLTNPAALFGKVAEMVPFMAAATGATLAGGPAGGTLVAYMVEGQNAWDAAKARGSTDREAETEAMIVGSINAAIEVMQIRAAIKFGSAGRKFLVDAVQKKLKEKFSKGLVRQGLKALMLASREGLEEVAQSFTSHGVPAVLGNADMDWEAFKREAPEEFVVAAISYMLPAIGGFAASRAQGGQGPAAPALETRPRPNLPGQVVAAPSADPGPVTGAPLPVPGEVVTAPVSKPGKVQGAPPFEGEVTTEITPPVPAAEVEPEAPKPVEKPQPAPEAKAEPIQPTEAKPVKEPTDAEEKAEEVAAKAETVLEAEVPRETVEIPEAEAKEAKRQAASVERKKLIKDFFSGRTARLGVDPTILKALVLEGKFHIENGVKKFADWSKKMVADLGEKVKPHLKVIWRDSRKAVAKDKETARIEARFAKAAKIKPVPTKQVQRRVTELAGKVRPEKVISNVRDLLKFSLRFQKKAGKAGFAAAIKSQTDLMTYARNNLTNSMLAKVAPAISKAGTDAQIARVVKAIDRLAGITIKERIEKTTTVPTEEVITTTRSLLKFALKKAQTVSKQVYRIAQTDQVETTKELIAYARQHLEGKDLDRVLNVIVTAKDTLSGAQIKRARRSIEVLAGTRIKQKAIAHYKEAKKAVFKAKFVRPEAKAKASKLLEGMTDTKTLASTLTRMKAIVKLVEVENDYRIPDALYKRALETMEGEGKTLVRDLDAEQIEGLAKALEEIVHISDTKNKLLAGRKDREVKTTAKNMPAEVKRDHPKVRKETDPGLISPRRKVGVLADVALGSLWSHELDVYALGGDKGATYDILYDSLRLGEDEARAVQEELLDLFFKGIEGTGVDFDTISRWSDPVFQELGFLNKIIKGKLSKGVEIVTVKLPRATSEGKRVPTREMTRGQRMSIYAHYQDPRTRRELLRNKFAGLSFRDAEAHSLKLYNEDYRAIIDSMSMSPEEVTVAEAGLESLRRAREIMEPKWVAEHGYSIFNQDTYWPRIRDKEFGESDPSELMRWFVQRQLDQQSIHKPRSHSDNPIIVTDFFSTLLAHFNKVGSYVGKHAPSQDMARVLTGREFGEFRNAVRTRVHNGEGLLDNLRKYHESYVGMDRVAQTSADKIMRSMLRRAQTGLLGFQPQVALYQQVSWLAVTNEMEAKYWIQGHSRKHGTKAEVDAALMEVSMFRARREGGAHRIITPGLGGSMLVESFKGRTEGRLAELGMKAISAMDWVVMRRIYRASVAKGKALGHKGDALKKYAQEEAERIVRLTQPTWDALNQARLQRWAARTPFLKPLVMFTSQTAKNMHMAIRAVLEYQKSEQTAADKTTMIRKVALPTLINAFLIAGIATGVNRFYKIIREMITGDDDEPKPSESFALPDMAKKTAERLAGTWIGTGNIVYDTGEVIVTGEMPYYKQGGSILGQAASDVRRTVASVHRVTGGEKKRRRKGSASDFRRGAESLIDAISVLTGLPLRGPKTILKKTGVLDELDE